MIQINENDALLCFALVSLVSFCFALQTLGLPGSAAPTRPKNKAKRAGAGAGSTGGSEGVLGGGAGGPDRYVSAFDLSSKAFRPGKPLHDRVLSCLGRCGGESSGRGDTDGEGVAVDMVVCWWGEGDGAGTQVRTNSGEPGQEETSVGGEGAVTATNRAACCGDNESREGGNTEERRNEQQQQQRECQEQWCREVSFPPSFSAEKIELTPKIRFFRDACCPDLDFVGQGFSSVASTAPPPSSRLEGGEDGGISTDNMEDSVLIANADNGNSGERSPQGVSHILPPRAPSPPGTTKCRLILDMFEWLGAVSCGLDAAVSRDPSPPEYLSEFETPRHLLYRRKRVLCRARLRGFLPPLAVARFVKASGLAAAGAAATAVAEVAGGHGEAEAEGLPQLSSSSLVLPISHGRRNEQGQQPDGSSWGSVTAWPFRDAPRAYPGADAPCAGGQMSKRGGGKHRSGNKGRSKDGVAGRGFAERSTKEWPVGGHGVYTVVACPSETAVAYVSARCPGPGW